MASAPRWRHTLVGRNLSVIGQHRKHQAASKGPVHTAHALWYNRIIRKESMIKYQVHFEKTTGKGIKRGIRTVRARNELEAIIKVKSVVEGSFGHWVNRLANEEAI
jgi:hypothetical protein